MDDPIVKLDKRRARALSEAHQWLNRLSTSAIEAMNAQLAEDLPHVRLYDRPPGHLSAAESTGPREDC